MDKEDNPAMVDNLRTKALSMMQMDEIRRQEKEKDKASLRVKYGIGESENALFSLSVDLYRCHKFTRRFVYFSYCCFLCSARSTPVEVLHTMLLGPYKYLLKEFMKRMSTDQKKELLAKLETFNYSGIDSKITGNLCYHYKSFVGRDYRSLAQIALHLLGSYFSDSEKAVWLALSKVYSISLIAINVAFLFAGVSILLLQAL